jgi:hypothetical protein
VYPLLYIAVAAGATLYMVNRPVVAERHVRLVPGDAPTAAPTARTG